MTNYEEWTREQLIEKIRLLERQQNTTSSGSGGQGTKKKEGKPFNFNAYAQRKVHSSSVITAGSIMASPSKLTNSAAYRRGCPL